MSNAPARDYLLSKGKKVLLLRRSSKPHRDQGSIVADIYQLLHPPIRGVVGVRGDVASDSPPHSSPSLAIAGAS
jgi:hypothetical protein